MGVTYEHKETLADISDKVVATLANSAFGRPALLWSDDAVLLDSPLIIRFVSSIAQSPWDVCAHDTSQVAKRAEIEGYSLAAMERVTQLSLEDRMRPPMKRYTPWKVRLAAELSDILDRLEDCLRQYEWDFSRRLPNLAEVSAAVAWSQCKWDVPLLIEKESYPTLEAMTLRAERLEPFRSTNWRCRTGVAPGSLSPRPGAFSALGSVFLHYFGLARSTTGLPLRRWLGGVAVELQSHLPIERQARVIGATWLDQQLIGGGKGLGLPQSESGVTNGPMS